MKFGDKLFFATTGVLTVIFTLFGMWMLSSYFQNLLNREIEQGNVESQMFQYLFEMAYQSLEEYGDDYAVPKAIEGVVENVEKEGVRCFVINENNEWIYGENLSAEEGFGETVSSLKTALQEENSYVYEIQNIRDKYYLVFVCGSETIGGTQCLGVCHEMTEIFNDRTQLLNQYRMALVVLLIVGGVCIFILSRLITRPLSSLEKVAGQIAEGNFEERSQYSKQDEIGALAKSFNQMADRLVEQMQEKELEARQKADFTAAFAHELKTPLTSIIGYADMLGTIQLSEEERQEAYFYIFSQGKRLESLSHKLLELVSLEKHPLVSKPISTKQFEENIRNTMRPILHSRAIKSRIDLEKGTIYGDFELLLSLFYNLLDNALKAVSEGGFILFKGQNLKDAYEIKVVDNGRGMPRQEISRITEAFYMVDKSRSRKEGGAGIGMALCKQIADMHHVTIKIDSNPGEGTVVKLIFPVKEGGESVNEKNTL